MDDRRSLFVIIFITFFVMVYVQWMFPQPTTAPATQQTAPAGAAPVPSVAVSPAPVPAAIPAGAAARPSAQQLKESPVTVVDTGVALVSINHLGGRIQSVRLKQYKQRLHSEEPFEMISSRDGAPLPLGVYADGTSDDFVLYQLDQTALPVINGSVYEVAGDGLVIPLTGELSTGTRISKSLRFKPGSYAAEVTVQLSRPSRDGGPVWLEWTKTIPESKQAELAHVEKLSFLSVEGKLQNTFIGDLKLPLVELGAGRWTALCDYYFLGGIIAPGEAGLGRAGHEQDLFFTRMSGTPAGGIFRIFSGPKELQTLRSVGAGLERSVDLGMFSFLAHPILSLMKFFNSFLGNYGLSIILLTLLIKLAFLPLTQSSFKSMQAMQDLQPEIKALRERIDDPNVLNQELMALYKKRGVNPLGGCLPILIQIPVFLGLYNALLNSIDLRHAPFALWITDLSAPEQLQAFGIGIPLMILIMGASMFIQQMTQPSAMDPQQKKVMMFMPVIFTGMFILHPMPSGLVLYWLVNNLISIVQQAYIKGHRNVSPLTATAYASLAMFCFGYVLTLIS